VNVISKLPALNEIRLVGLYAFAGATTDDFLVIYELISKREILFYL